LGGATDAIAADCTSRVGCGLRAGDPDRLQVVSFIQRLGEATVLGGFQSTVS
jgi:hypothetical protein